MNTKRLGIDIGSTTAKVVLIDQANYVVYSSYARHNTRIVETLQSLLKELIQKDGDQPLRIRLTGSAGMGLAEKTGIPFVQEVVAAGTHAKALFPDTQSLLDIGGEDAKLILFEDQKKPDIRMNGNCAGGTGAYIDQMASLLNVAVSDLDALARKAEKTYPMASRCGVFAKTDVQNLISRKIGIEEIAASIFEAVASQIINSLARGCSLGAPLLFSGGPLSYMSYLRECILKQLGMDAKDAYLPASAELFTAHGAALSCSEVQSTLMLSDFRNKLNKQDERKVHENSLPALFAHKQDYTHWEQNRKIIPIPQRNVEDGDRCFIGIDSGSTTAKIVVLSEAGEVLYRFYQNNKGHSLETVVGGLQSFRDLLSKEGKNVQIIGTAVTGYGEDLIRTALNLDHGLVETVAHFKAAQKLEPEVSFVLDIGGQDMKAVYVRNQCISNIEINEACSSGCGSFIENFAQTLGYGIPEFADMALHAERPYDLGSRCTVFMNSKVKQALRDGASVEDLSAGLAYSVVKNCLYKVLKIKSSPEIGEHIVVQGGTFRNKAVFRALESLSGKTVVSSDMPELMGAYGAALYAADKFAQGHQSHFAGLDHLSHSSQYTLRTTSCKGCTNNCTLSVYSFSNGQKCFAGNKCEKVFSNPLNTVVKGENIFAYKRERLFATRKAHAPKGIRIGIPRVLNMYENFPFWNTLFSECGIEVVLSDDSSNELYKKGDGYVMSDNICFPAKLSHGHIINLVDKKVDRIFLPFVVYEKKAFKDSANSFNCPIVTAYSEVLKNPGELLQKHHIEFDSPGINFNDKSLLKKACVNYLSGLGVAKSSILKALDLALQSQFEFKEDIRLKNQEILHQAKQAQQPVVLVASHPYHIDPLIHQQSSQILADLGVSVINEEIALGADEGFTHYFAISQWEYPNRILQAAWWVSQQNDPIGLIQLNSFGCGPDSFIMDEISDLSKTYKLPFALVRIDEITSTGSLKLRLRSLVESMKLRTSLAPEAKEDLSAKGELNVFSESDKEKTILVPWFSDFYSPFIPVLGKISGYNLVNLPPSDHRSADLGLEFAHNEICYPATLVVGDIVKALESKEYDLDNIAIGITQTGGQCRATNYISLIKRAMANAGYSDIPVISVAPSDSVYNHQPGFNLDWKKLIRPTFFSLLFADSLARLYYAVVSRQRVAVDADLLRDRYIRQALQLVEAHQPRELLGLLKKAVKDFQCIDVIPDSIPVVGVVGEIYIKYNAFGQFRIIDWLIENRVEVVIPPLYEFMMQAFENDRALKKDHIKSHSGFKLVAKFLEWEAEHHIKRFEKVLEKFAYYRPVAPMKESAAYASEIVSLSNQYGEGWLIPAEIASFSRQNIHDIICLQPFGCIANHIIGKGIEKKIKDRYPKVNLLFLDFDYDTSKVNLLNRLHFLIQNKEEVPLEAEELS